MFDISRTKSLRSVPHFGVVLRIQTSQKYKITKFLIIGIQFNQMEVFVDPKHIYTKTEYTHKNQNKKPPLTTTTIIFPFYQPLYT